MPQETWVNLMAVKRLRITCGSCKGAASVDFTHTVQVNNLVCPTCTGALLTDGEAAFVRAWAALLADSHHMSRISLLVPNLVD